MRILTITVCFALSAANVYLAYAAFKKAREFFRQAKKHREMIDPGRSVFHNESETRKMHTMMVSWALTCFVMADFSSFALLLAYFSLSAWVGVM